jgi:hypothetical protein
MWMVDRQLFMTRIDTTVLEDRFGRYGRKSGRSAAATQ